MISPDELERRLAAIRRRIAVTHPLLAAELDEIDADEREWRARKRAGLDVTDLRLRSIAKLRELERAFTLAVTKSQSP